MLNVKKDSDSPKVNIIMERTSTFDWKIRKSEEDIDDIQDIQVECTPDIQDPSENVCLNPKVSLIRLDQGKIERLTRENRRETEIETEDKETQTAIRKQRGVVPLHIQIRTELIPLLESINHRLKWVEIEVERYSTLLPIIQKRYPAPYYSPTLYPNSSIIKKMCDKDIQTERTEPQKRLTEEEEFPESHQSKRMKTGYESEFYELLNEVTGEMERVQPPVKKYSIDEILSILPTVPISDKQTLASPYRGTAATSGRINN